MQSISRPDPARVAALRVVARAGTCVDVASCLPHLVEEHASETEQIRVVLGCSFLTGQITKFDDLVPDDFRRHSPRFQGENFT